MRINSTLYFILKDHLGSASVLTDNSGAVVTNANVRYYPFGGARSDTDLMLTDKLFTGQREIKINGIDGLSIYDYGARFYSPYLNQFTQPDTIVPDPYNPQSLNRYSYALNNPIRYTDPTGHRPCEDYQGSCLSENQVTKINRTKQEKIKEKSKNKSKDETSNKLVDFLYGAATVTQNIATLIDIPFAITEGIFIVGECIAAPLAGCATGAFMGQAAFNLTGANFLETAFSGASLALTVTADAFDDGQLGEASGTSLVTFLAGGLMFDPIGDVIIDGYASGYNNGTFNGINTLMNGGPLVIPK